MACCSLAAWSVVFLSRRHTYGSVLIASLLFFSLAILYFYPFFYVVFSVACVSCSYIVERIYFCCRVLICRGYWFN